MNWLNAYAQAVKPYLWIYVGALVLAALIFLALPRLRKHLAPVIILLVGRQVLDTFAAIYAPELYNVGPVHLRPENPLATIGQAIAVPTPTWLAIGHFFFFIGMVHYIYVAIREYLDFLRPNRRRHSTLLGWIVYGSVIVAAAMIYLEMTEANISLGIGIASLAAVVGFALQETLANLFAGLTLEADPPFRVGHWIHGEGFTGEVIDITWRATRLRTYENDMLVIPNRQLANAMIVNWSSFNRNHGVHLSIGTSYADAPGRVKQSILTALHECEGVLATPPPEVYTKDYGDFAITHDILFFITEYKEQNRIKDRLFSRLWYQFRRDNIKIPFPIRDINLHTLSARDRAADVEQEMNRKIGLLEKLPLFSSLPGEELRYLASEAHFQRYWQGENIIRQGDVPCFLSILVEGTAKVLLRTSDVAASDRNIVVHHHDKDGTDHAQVHQPETPAGNAVAAALPPVELEVQGGYAEVSQLKAGDFFGEISVLLGKQASATVQSADELLLLVIDRQAFVKVLDKHREFQLSICQVISQRVQFLRHVSKLAQDKKDDVAEEPRTLITNLRRFLHLHDDTPAR